MTFNEKGLLRAMKSAYREYGYTVAQTENGLLITTDSWGVGIREDLIPYVVKGLIVSHAGKLPSEGCAIFIAKDSVSNKIYEMAASRARDIKQAWSDGLTKRIYPTRVTLDGMNIWQKTSDLKMEMVDPDDMQILDMADMEAYEVARAIYCENYAGIIWVEPADPEDKNVLLRHLEQMQFVAGGHE